MTTLVFDHQDWHKFDGDRAFQADRQLGCDTWLHGKPMGTGNQDAAEWQADVSPHIPGDYG
jgi:hypothetical protein